MCLIDCFGSHEKRNNMLNCHQLKAFLKRKKNCRRVFKDIHTSYSHRIHPAEHQAQGFIVGVVEEAVKLKKD